YSLGLVCPENDEIMARTNHQGFVESPLSMGIEGKFQERVNVSSLDLKALRDRDTDDLAAVDVIDGKARLARAEDSGDVRIGEILKVIGDCRLDAAQLFGRLGEPPVLEVIQQFRRLPRILPFKHFHDLSHQIV